MDMHRKTAGRTVTDLDARCGRIVTVAPPSPGEGIGRALHSAYRSIVREGVPDDMMALLAKLDRR
ncbi:NepR family anti-sigma factor [Sphingobium cloacae]|nr:NepR family anti-sigma factor [Sphingobium cloacae]